MPNNIQIYLSKCLQLKVPVLFDLIFISHVYELKAIVPFLTGTYNKEIIM